MSYVTLGDLAEEFRKMLADGVSLGSIEYVLDRVYWEEYDARAKRAETFQSLADATKCGDYPAPCNCDDPTTHGGHK